MAISDEVAADQYDSVLKVQYRRDYEVGRILEASLECVMDVGYAATSMSDVAIRAQLPLETVLDYFPALHLAVIAACEWAAEARLYEILVRDPDPSQYMLLVLESMSGPLFIVVTEIWFAARVDTTILPAVRELGDRLDEILYGGVAAIVGNTLSPELIVLGSEMARGMSVTSWLREPEKEAVRRQWLLAAWHSVVESHRARDV